MASVISRERPSASLSLALPLSAPSVPAAWSFLSWVVPPTVFSSGSGLRRRRGEQLRPAGQRSDQGYLVFYRTDMDGQVLQQPLKSPTSIQTYLRQQLATAPADHWVALQTTQYTGKRNGRQSGEGFTAARARHLLAIVMDLDGGRMAPRYRRLLLEDFYSFTAELDDLLAAVGVECYQLIRSGPEGVHLYLPLIRPDGKPLRATERNVAVWEKVARAIGRYLAELGADANAVRPTQPFVIPGLPRAKHLGFVPYSAGGRDGDRADLFALLRSLSALRLVAAKERVSATSDVFAVATDIQALLADVRERAAGVSRGGRNQVAHDLAVYLLCKGASPGQAWAALEAWNERNDPALRQRELAASFESAERCEGRYPDKWRAMKRAWWVRLRRLLELPIDMAGYVQGGRWRPITPAKTWEQRKFAGGREHYHEVEERLLTHLEAQGGRWEITQGELAELLGTAVSTLKEVVKRLVAAERIHAQTRRGRGGKTVLVACAAPAILLDENSQSGIAPLGVEKGAWVGVSVSSGSVSASGDPVAILREVVQELGLDLSAQTAVSLVAVVAGGEWRAVATSPAGRDLLRLLSGTGGLEEWRRRLQRGWLTEVAATADPWPGPAG